MQDKEKNKEQPGILETVHMVNEKEKKKNEEERLRLEKEEEIEREEYSHKLEEEKIELLKIKQGIIKESDILDLSSDEKKHYNLWQKFKNFIYHNKWWLGIFSFFILIAAFLIYDKVTTVKADINVLLLSNDTDLYSHYKSMCDVFDSYVDDYNDDEKQYVNIIYIPISDDESENTQSLYGYDNNLTNLSTQFQLGETMMIIADSKSSDLIQPENTLENLEVYFPDCPYVKGYGLYLKDTKFAELIGYEENTVPDDLYIGIRKVTTNLSSEKDTKKNHDHSIETLRKIINDLSK